MNVFPIRDRPVRLGVIGCGNVLTAYQEPIQRLRAEGKVVVTMACGRPRQRAFACQALTPKHFTLENKRVIESPDVDLVLILTSMSEHGPLVSAALAASKHVLVEKPLATDLAQAKKILRQSRTTHLVCAPFTLLSPTFQAMAGHLQNGDIGRPCNARYRYGWAGPDWNEWFFQKGGGSIFDLGVYGLTSLTGLLGPVQRVTALAGIAQPQRKVRGKSVSVRVDDNAQLLLDFGSGCFASVMTGFTLQQYRSPALEIYGTDGTIQMLGDDWGPEGYELWQNRVGAWKVFKETNSRWSWTAGLDHLVDCLRSGTHPLITPEHACHVLEVMIQAQRSAATGRAMPVQSRFRKPQCEFKSKDSTEAYRVHDRRRSHDNE